MSIYVVGNGYIEHRDGHYWVDHHTGDFLLEVKQKSGKNVAFVDFKVERDRKGFFQDFSLQKENLDFVEIRIY